MAEGGETEIHTDASTITMDDVVQAAVRAVLLHQQTMSGPQNATSPQPSVPTQPPFRNSEIAALLPPFNGFSDDVERWLDGVEAVQNAYQVPESIVKLIAVGKLENEAKKWYQSKVTHITMEWENFKEELKAMFKKRVNKVEAVREFEKRRWGRNESFPAYFAEKVRLGNIAGLNDDDIKEYMIDGIDNVMLQNFVRINNPVELTNLLDIMKDVKKEDNKHTRKFHNHNAIVPKTNVNSSEQKVRQELRCYNCDSIGHIARNCQKPRRARGSCYECGSTEHQVKACPKKNQTISVIQSTGTVGKTKKNVVTINLIAMDGEAREGSIQTTCLIDTGSPISFIKSEFVHENNYNMLINDRDKFIGINKSHLNVLGIYYTEIVVDCTYKIKVKLYVVPDDTMSYGCVLGTNVVEPQSFLFKDEILNNASDPVENPFAEILNVQFDPEPENKKEMLNVEEGTDLETKAKISLIYENSYKNNFNDSVVNEKHEMKIKLKSDAPIYFRPRRLSYHEKEKLQAILDDLLGKGIIRPSNSEYASRVVLVRKKNNEIRLCVDFRELNKITIRDNFPTPLIDDNLDLLRDKRYYSALDLKNGFYHIKMHADSVKYTAFITPMGQYEYVRMPFGLTNAPRVFQRFISDIFHELIRSHNIIFYMDDLLIATEDLNEHLDILRRTFEIAATNGLKFRLDKCFFLRSVIDYLGYTVSQEGIKPNPENVESVRNYPIPTNPKAVQRFLGLASYFRRFIPSFSLKAKPLYDLIKKDVKFKFGEQELIAFETLKEHLIQAPILAIFSPLLETEIHCDASAKGLAGILMQKQKDGLFRPVRYLSKRTTEYESRLHSYELEMLAIVYTVQKLHVYLQGIKFKIVTDCAAVKMAFHKKIMNPRIERWIMEMSNYDYDIEHRSNTKMQHVDALSRCHNICVIEENSFEQNLNFAQNLDPRIRELQQELETTERKDFELHDGLVYRKTKNDVLFYVPEKMEKNVIVACHDDLGHTGIDKTMEYISRSYWFPEMKRKVSEHVANCLKCIAYNNKSGRQEGNLHPIPKGNLPFVTIHVDHYGPLSQTRKKNKYVFEIIDAFSKFVTLFAVKSVKTSEVLSCLKTYFRYYSTPLRIISDRGSAFKSADFEAFMDEYNIQHVKVAPFTPEANGQIERINRDLTPMLSKLTKLGGNWDEILPEVEFAMNNTYCRAISDSPARLLFGVNQRDKNDVMRYYLHTESERNLNQLRTDASASIEKTQEYNRTYYNDKHKLPVKYEVGDFVMIKNVDVTPGIQKKLLPKFKGPYEVKKRLDNDRYLVGDIEGFQISQIPYESVCSPKNMKRWLH